MEREKLFYAKTSSARRWQTDMFWAPRGFNVKSIITYGVPNTGKWPNKRYFKYKRKLNMSVLA